jgi:hypothetical protein
MRAYKFLARGAVGPFSGFAWPTPTRGAPDAWVVAQRPLEPCRHGVHVCRETDLAHWLHEELWELEVDGGSVEGVDCLVVERARLVRRIDAWSDGGAGRFAAACIARAAALVGPTPAVALAALVDDAALALEHGYPAIAAFNAALAVARGAGDVEAAYAAERAWQSGWIGRELILPSR